jgi:hypothetical protein
MAEGLIQIPLCLIPPQRTVQNDSRLVRHSRMFLAGPPQDFGRIRPSAEIQAKL